MCAFVVSGRRPVASGLVCYCPAVHLECACAAKMTKLQLLNAFLSERLAALVREVVSAVDEAVSEFREEAARARRESEGLRRQLQHVLLLEAETEWLSKCRVDTGFRSRRSGPALFPGSLTCE